MNRIFVYGTLKRNNRLHSRFLNNPNFTNATIKGVFLKTDMGLPYALADPKGESVIKGEIYDVPSERLKFLDNLEGHPNWYKRTWMTAVHEDGTEERVEIYLLQREDKSKELFLIPSGNWNKDSLSEAANHAGWRYEDQYNVPPGVLV